MMCSEHCEAQTQLNNALEELAELKLKLEQASQKLEQVTQENAQTKMENSWLREQLRLKIQREFGHSKDSNSDQLALFHFNEAEQLASPAAEEPTLTPSASALPKTPRKRKPSRERKDLWENLPVQRTVHTIPEGERACPHCGEERRKITEEVSRRLGVIPARFYVEEVVREVFVCDGCQEIGEHAPITTAEAPEPPIKKSIASASLLAYIADLKYCDGLPLYRIEKMLKRMDLSISRQNLANWMICISDMWLKPLYDELHNILLTKDILHSDATVLQVLKEPGRSAQTQSSMWVYNTGRSDAENSIVLFEYQQTKEAKWPKEFLRGFSGYLHVDGAPTYDAAKLLNVILIGCLSHARRGFVNALKVAPKGSKTWGTHAHRGQEFCDMLFDLEREYDKLKLSPEERAAERELYSRVVLDAFYEWLVTERPNVQTQSYTGKAMDYCLKQWTKLSNFMLDGRLECSNNAAERCIKPFVMARKCFLFSNTPSGANASAILFSIVETAKANNLKPYDYLKWLLEQLPNIRLTSSELQQLLPWSPHLPSECRLSQN